jgi:ABC-type multidrug transport system fused ATPase/permease subunit
MRWPAFHRARRYGEKRAIGRAAVIACGILTAALVCLLILLAGLLVDLLDFGGDLSVVADDAVEVEQIVGPPDEITATAARYFNRGLLPFVWRTRETLIGPLASAIYDSTDVWANNFSALLTLLIIALAVAAIAALAMERLECAVQRRATSAAERLRSEIHRQAVRLGASDLFAGAHADTNAVFQAAVEAVRSGMVAWYRVVPQAIALLVGLGLIALLIQPWLALSAIAFSLLCWIFVGRRYAAERHQAILLADRARQQSGLLAEDMRQARFLGNFFAVDRVSGQPFDERLRRYHAAIIDQHASTAGTGPVIFFLILLGGGVILLLGGINILRDPPQGSVATTFVLIAALMSALYPLRRIERLRAVLPEADRAGAEVFYYLERQPTVAQLPDAAALPRLSRSIDLENVSLSDFDGRPLLRDVTVSLPAGSRAVVFSSSHNSPLALAGLLCRFYDPTSGAVLFDSKNIRSGTIESVRRQIALIVYDSLLVTGTVAENISCGDRRYSMADCMEAARVVHAYEFVQRLPQGFDTIIGEHGVTLRASESMRIGLARAVLRSPSVIVIDEPPVLPDVHETELLAESIRRAAAGRWLIVLGKRLATLRAADRILLLHDGELVGDGNHTTLLETSEIYRHLNYVRFSELAAVVT